MEEVKSNLIDQPLDDMVGENAKRLENLINTVNWKNIVKFLSVAYGFLLLGVSLFLLVIRIILKITE